MIILWLFPIAIVVAFGYYIYDNCPYFKKAEPQFRIRTEVRGDGSTKYYTERRTPYGTWVPAEVYISSVLNILGTKITYADIGRYSNKWHTKEDAEAAIQCLIKDKRAETVVDTKYEYYSINNKEDKKITQMERIIKDLEAELEKVKGEKEWNQ